LFQLERCTYLRLCYGFFRAGRDLSLFFVCAVVSSVQEEISHCAAGVRWLKHLHKVATSSQLPPGSTAAAAAAAGGGGKAETNSSTQQQQQQQANGSSTAAAAADWAADARKYETVEEWFHSLIRSHFKGTLKV
jgi:hypothetical protein